MARFQALETVSENIDQICRMTESSTALNALHACRPGHPWNKTTERPFGAALFIAQQRPSWEIDAGAIIWLTKMAQQETARP